MGLASNTCKMQVCICFVYSYVLRTLHCELILTVATDENCCAAYYKKARLWTYQTLTTTGQYLLLNSSVKMSTVWSIITNYTALNLIFVMICLQRVLFYALNKLSGIIPTETLKFTRSFSICPRPLIWCHTICCEKN